jgi:hypothetical protein
MPAIWTLDKPCDHALWFDRSAFDFRSAYLAHVHGRKFFVSRFAHVTEWISNVWTCEWESNGRDVGSPLGVSP